MSKWIEGKPKVLGYYWVYNSLKNPYIIRVIEKSDTEVMGLSWGGNFFDIDESDIVAYMVLEKPMVDQASSEVTAHKKRFAISITGFNPLLLGTNDAVKNWLIVETLYSELEAKGYASEKIKEWLPEKDGWSSCQTIREIT